MVLFYCPITNVASAGLRIVHRQVEILNRHGIEAAVVYLDRSKSVPDMPIVPVRYVLESRFDPDDIFVAPEGEPILIRDLPQLGIRRRFVIALNWDYIFGLAKYSDWRESGIERVLTHSRHIADMVQWSMGLATHVFGWGINPSLYFPDPAQKQPEAIFIKRKQQRMGALLRLLNSRNSEFVQRIRWVEADQLPEATYATCVRRSQVFINLSQAEGLPCSLLEAMRAGTIVAGYNSVGGRDQLIGDGPKQNCILAENLDYVTLAQKLEPLLLDIIKNDTSRWDHIRQNAFETAAPFTPESEEASVIAMWRTILENGAPPLEGGER